MIFSLLIEHIDVDESVPFASVGRDMCINLTNRSQYKQKLISISRCMTFHFGEVLSMFRTMGLDHCLERVLNWGTDRLFPNKFVQLLSVDITKDRCVTRTLLVDSNFFWLRVRN